jgi:hypothetical protein
MSGCLLYSLHWPLTNHIRPGASYRSNRIRYLKGCLYPRAYTSLCYQRIPSSFVRCRRVAGKRSLAAGAHTVISVIVRSRSRPSNDIVRQIGDVTDGTAAVVCVFLGHGERVGIARLYRPVATVLILYSVQSGLRMYETP